MLASYPNIRTAIFGNVGTFISSRVGSGDAELISKEFNPPFDVLDFVHLPRYSMYLKLMIDGATARPFSAETLAPIIRSEGLKNEVIMASQKAFGRRASVEMIDSDLKSDGVQKKLFY